MLPYNNYIDPYFLEMSAKCTLAEKLKPLCDIIIKKLPTERTKYDIYVLMEYTTAFWTKEEKAELYKSMRNVLPGCDRNKENPKRR